MGMVIKHIAEHQRRSLEPRQSAQCRQIRLHDVVAITRLPARRLVALDGFHFHIRRLQIIAAMGFVDSAFKKKLCLEALTH